MKTQLCQLFERIRWSPKLRDQQPFISVAYIHRGAENDERIIPWNDITFEAQGIVLRDHNGIAFWLPAHRIKKVWNTQTNEVLYTKTEKEEV